MTTSKLNRLLPWVQEPLIVSAPMRPFATHELATAVTLANGLGFIPNGNHTEHTRSELEAASKIFASAALPQDLGDILKHSLPVGLGYQIYQESLEEAVELISEFKPIAVWLFAARQNEDYERWAEAILKASPNTTIWIQVGTIAEALAVVKLCGNEIVLVLQGSDAGGHGLQHSAGLITLLPEAADTLRQYDIPILAAGGISEARGAAAALSLGADGIVMGTRFLAASEAKTPKGFVEQILHGNDGGRTTRRTRLFDNIRGTGDFPSEYDGRALINQSIIDGDDGIPEDETKREYQDALKTPSTGYGEKGRLVSYAGTGIGLVTEVKSAREIVEETRRGVVQVIESVQHKASRWKVQNRANLPSSTVVI